MGIVNLELDEDEARRVHAALAVTVEILERVDPGPGAILVRGDVDSLALVARRLDHERRHRGEIPNPNGP